MRRLIVFNHVTMDGYFVDINGSIDWARTDKEDKEWNTFVAENANSGEGTLLFGRVTYELMIRYWPTPVAIKHDQAVAERMNSLPKVVFSRTLNEVSWNNTRLVNNDMVAEVQKMKSEPGDGMTIIGSGSIVSQLAREGLIDEFQIVVNPVVLGYGRTMFAGLSAKLPLKLTKSRTFGNGCVYLCYQPTA